MEDEQPPEDPDLRRREPDAVGVVHQQQHPLGQPLELVVEGLDLVRAHPHTGSPYWRICDNAIGGGRAAPPARRSRDVVVVVIVVSVTVVVIVLVVVIVVVPAMRAV